MKKILLKESLGTLSARISEVDTKETSLLTQLNEAKEYLIAKVSKPIFSVLCAENLPRHN